MQLDYKFLRSLTTASARRREGCFLAEGHHLVGEALQWGRVQLLAVEEGRKDLCSAEIEKAESMGVPVYYLPSSRMKSLSQTQSHQGLLCVVEYRHRSFAPDCLPESGLVCILERVQDPGNVGTILRTADALGCEAVFLTADSADVTNDKALRASMGAIYRVPVYLLEDMKNTLTAMSEQGWKVFCGDLHGMDFFATERSFPKQAFLVGNEGSGVLPETAQLCSHRIRLPMPGHAESLNAAVASAVALYDLSREMGRF